MGATAPKNVHCVSKNVPPLTCYNLYTCIYGSIATLLGTNVAERVGNQSVLYFPTSPNSCFCTTWGNRKPGNYVFSQMLHAFLPKHTKHSLETMSFHKCCMVFYQKKNETRLKKYHLLRAEPPSTVKPIDSVHLTGPRNGA